tara:strand:+ start:18 stop:290 length:273 start_codon:yes stop_codon:yes gene_type:complete
MFILTIHGKEDQGAYSVKNEEGEHVLYLFEQEDDATRYAMQLEDNDYPEMHVLEVDPEMMLGVCEEHGYGYSIITPNDIVIPPNVKNDFI